MSSVAEPAATYRSEHKRRVNDLIHDSIHDEWDTEPVAFFTESVPVSAPEAARAASGAARAAASRQRTRYRRISLAVSPGLVRFT